MTNIPTELLRTFVKAADLGNFTRAGDAIGRSQSAVSLQIQRLESLLNVELFVRGAHRLRLTDDGATLLHYATRILSLNDEAVVRLRPSDVTGSIRLGAPHEYNATLLSAILGKFSKDYPNVALEVVCDLSKNLLSRQKKGQLDIAIALHEEATQSGVKIVTEPLVWIGGVESQDRNFDPLPLVVAPPPCIYRSRIVQALQHTSINWRFSFVSSSYTGIIAAVRAGLGVTALAASTIPDGIIKLGKEQGLPELGDVEVRVHTQSEKLSDAIQCLIEYSIYNIRSSR
ncbi:LysR family transcriptional regulator [Burkholderia cenocepacia]|uniref:LysR substrate-binding domain-containing protein n=1 Tax=Burkholderia cenocepacia TaxID=95486 RepID=UPI000F5B9450|nr:LysR substrate-binding domain-containing protein [Burkholderia cenocepacia]RQU98421.1 LysR family transcriptional regulator [Burkholderia cenocepacia]